MSEEWDDKDSTGYWDFMENPLLGNRQCPPKYDYVEDREFTPRPPYQLKLRWWRKDRYGWPIETYKNKPFKSFVRIVFQNIRKVTG